MPLNNDTALNQVASGSFTGNNAMNRAIPHGLPGTPCLVVIICTSTSGTAKNGFISGTKAVNLNGDNDVYTAMDSTNIYVGQDGTVNFNTTGATYVWVAFLAG